MFIPVKIYLYRSEVKEEVRIAKPFRTTKYNLCPKTRHHQD